MNLTCPSCGAKLTPGTKICIYCGSPVTTFLSSTDKAEIKSFLQMYENYLLSKKNKYDSMNGLFFLSIILIFIFSSYLGYGIVEGFLLKWFLIIFWGFALFIFFGWYVTYNEARAYRDEFEFTVKAEILSFISEKGYSKSDFKLVMGECLSTNSVLFRFMHKF